MLMIEVTAVKNEQSRHGGFSPAQWVLAKQPNRPGGRFDEDTYADMGILSSKSDLDSAFAKQEDLRL